MAAPFVAGVAALIRSQTGWVDSASISNIILKNSRGRLRYPSVACRVCDQNGGILDAYEAVKFTAQNWIPCEYDCRLACEQRCKDDCYESIVMDPTCLLNPGLCQIRYGECLNYCESPVALTVCTTSVEYRHCRSTCSQ